MAAGHDSTPVERPSRTWARDLVGAIARVEGAVSQHILTALDTTALRQQNTFGETITYERSDEIPYMVVKRDGRREKFDRQKILEGLLKACEKRPVPMPKLAEVVDEVESKLADSSEREISTTEVGELLMGILRILDKIAYVRFASVYRDFQDVEAFLVELKDLLQRRG